MQRDHMSEIQHKRKKFYFLSHASRSVLSYQAVQRVDELARITAETALQVLVLKTGAAVCKHVTCEVTRLIIAQFHNKSTDTDSPRDAQDWQTSQLHRSHLHVFCPSSTTPHKSQVILSE